MNRSEFIKLLFSPLAGVGKSDSVVARSQDRRVIWSQYRRNFHPHSLAEFELRGNVRTVSVMPLRVHKNMQVEQELLSTFNEKGYAVRQEMLQGFVKGHTTEWVLADEDTFVGQRQFYASSSRKLLQRLAFKYDKDGVLQGMDWYKHEVLVSSAQFTYNSYGWLVRQVDQSPDPEMRLVRNLGYDDAGNITSESEIWEHCQCISHSDFMQYDEAGRVVQKVVHFPGNVSASQFTYNDHGLVSAIDRSGHWEHFDYSYDSFGNWIERVSFIKGELASRELRKITYY